MRTTHTVSHQTLRKESDDYGSHLEGMHWETPGTINLSRNLPNKNVHASLGITHQQKRLRLADGDLPQVAFRTPLTTLGRYSFL